ARPVARRRRRKRRRRRRRAFMREQARRREERGDEDRDAERSHEHRGSTADGARKGGIAHAQRATLRASDASPSMCVARSTRYAPHAPIVDFDAATLGVSLLEEPEI